jgi:hypothetical protein
MTLVQTSTESKTSLAKVITIIAIALLMATLILLHVQGVTGPKFWFWPMRRESALRVYLPMLIAIIPLVVAHALYARWCGREKFLLPLLMITAYAMMIINILAPTRPASFDLLRDCVRSPYAMSYYNDAQALQGTEHWLAMYPQILPQLSMHTQSKPAGPLLYFTAFINVMGYNDRTAIVSGLCIGLIATFSIVATYFAASLLSDSKRTGFFAASLLAICPGFVLSFPLFDPAYIIFSAALIAFWAKALSTNRPIYSILFGVTLALMLLVTYTVLIAGAFLLAYTVCCTGLSVRAAIDRAMKHAGIALGTCALLLGIFWLLTGYNMVEAFRSAWVNQQRLVLTEGSRRWPRTIPFDLWDFALGTAWVLIPLAGFGLCRAWREPSWNDRLVRVMTCALALPLLTALTALLPLETARVWNFQLPLLLLPAGYELTHWSPGARWIAIACVWIGLATLMQNVWIVLPWA